MRLLMNYLIARCIGLAAGLKCVESRLKQTIKKNKKQITENESSDDDETSTLNKEHPDNESKIISIALSFYDGIFNK